MVSLVITNLIAFRTATTNYVMLIPVLLSIFHVWDDRWGAVGKGLISFTSALLGIGLWVLFLLTVDGNVESAVMYLPLPVYLPDRIVVDALVGDPPPQVGVG